MHIEREPILEKLASRVRALDAGGLGTGFHLRDEVFPVSYDNEIGAKLHRVFVSPATKRVVSRELTIGDAVSVCTKQIFCLPFPAACSLRTGDRRCSPQPARRNVAHEKRNESTE